MKKIKWILGIALVGSLVSLMSCGAIAAALAAPQGYVYNGRTGAAIPNVTVQLKDMNGTVLKSATTNNNGYYSFLDVDYGTFELTANGAGYTFIEQIVDVSGLAQVLPNIAGLASDIDGDGTDDLESGVLTIVTFWDRSFQDVDAHFTFPNVGTLGTATFAADKSDFYNITSSSTNTHETDGFLPTTDTGRFHLRKDNEVSPLGATKDTSGTGGDIWLDVDNVGHSSQPAGGPETVTVYWPPSQIDGVVNYNGTYSYTSDNSSTTDPSRLPNGNYSCVGVMEFYLDAWSNTEPSTVAGGSMEPGVTLASQTNTNTADPVVYVFDGISQIARYRLPQYTDIERASIFRINMFVQEADGNIYYQLLPDLKLFTDDGLTFANIRSSEGMTAEPVVMKARSRK